MKRYHYKWLGYLMIPMLVVAASVAAVWSADFNLAWDPPSESGSTLIGYNIYYKAESSILADPDGSVMIYVPLTEQGFDPANPKYEVADLLDDTPYYFTVTAMSEEHESGMSNEVRAIGGTGVPTSAIETSSPGSGGGAGGGGCFIGTLVD